MHKKQNHFNIQSRFEIKKIKIIELYFIPGWKNSVYRGWLHGEFNPGLHGVSGILVFRPFCFWYTVFYCSNRLKYGYKVSDIHPRLSTRADKHIAWNFTGILVYWASIIEYIGILVTPLAGLVNLTQPCPGWISIRLTKLKLFTITWHWVNFSPGWVRISVGSNKQWVRISVEISARAENSQCNQSLCWVMFAHACLKMFDRIWLCLKFRLNICNISRLHVHDHWTSIVEHIVELEFAWWPLIINGALNWWGL
jgi:hypothetical protein